MRFDSLDSFLQNAAPHLAKGPIAAIFVEDEIEVNSTIRHHLACGFRKVLVFLPSHIGLAPDVAPQVWCITYDTSQPDAATRAINQLIPRAAGQWLYYCFNSEYLFFPFCETRSIGEMLQFHTEERRDAMLCYVVDLYAKDLKAHPVAVSLDDAYLDKAGYFALARTNPATGHPYERQLDFFGGLRWRFEEHIPQHKRKIDRVALLRAKPGLSLLPDHRTNDQEYNTYACPWHNNLSAAICSFRTAKALKRNPGSTFDIHSFCWHNSTPFTWHSGQLLDLGLIEPGQWF